MLSLILFYNFNIEIIKIFILFAKKPSYLNGNVWIFTTFLAISPRVAKPALEQMNFNFFIK
jgi:predicted anti-sigma-YlaC factor YlaD